MKKQKAIIHIGMLEPNRLPVQNTCLNFLNYDDCFLLINREVGVLILNVRWWQQLIVIFAFRNLVSVISIATGLITSKLAYYYALNAL